MRNILLIMFLALMMVACHTQSKISKQEVAKFSVKGDSILYEGNYVAKFLSVEYEYYRGRKTLEISVEKINGGADQMCDKLVDYIIYKHPKAKAEVKIPR